MPTQTHMPTQTPNLIQPRIPTLTVRNLYFQIGRLIWIFPWKATSIFSKTCLEATKLRKRFVLRRLPGDGRRRPTGMSSPLPEIAKFQFTSLPTSFLCFRSFNFLYALKFLLLSNALQYPNITVNLSSATYLGN